MEQTLKIELCHNGIEILKELPNNSLVDLNKHNPAL